MGALELIVIVVAAIAVIATVVWFLVARKHPEQGATHGEPPRTGSALMFGDVDDRPGDPGSEAQSVSEPGEPAPGPPRQPPENP